jgi:hypothetical protein
MLVSQTSRFGDAKGSGNPPPRPDGTNPPAQPTGTGTGTTTGQSRTPPQSLPTASTMSQTGSMVSTQSQTNTSGTRFDVNSIPLEMVAAIEIYLDIGSVPPLYRSSHDECGVILIWTK